MTKHTINLDGDYSVTKGPRDKSWISTVTVPLSAIVTEMVERATLHGLHQKIADAASGATNESEATALMQKAVDAILAGEWSRRGTGGGVDEFTAVARSITRSAMKVALGGKSPEWAAFTGLSDDDQNAKLDENFESNRAVLEPSVNAEIERRAESRKAKAGLAGKVTFSL